MQNSVSDQLGLLNERSKTRYRKIGKVSPLLFIMLDDKK